MEIINDINFKSKSIGKKAHNLFLLKENNINVPDLFCVKLNGKNDNINEYIDKNCSDTDFFAVRSSSSVEDNDTMSFAGQFKTFLNVPKSSIISKINECSSSNSSKSLDRYIEEKKITKKDIQISVIVQKMINSDKSGVIFTSNPQGILNETVIVVGNGIGNNIVEDRINTTTYYYNRTDNLYYYETQGDSARLEVNKIKEIIEIVIKIEKILGKNLDIEFAIKDDKIYILQARKITTLNNNEIVLDNSNIVESYPGVSLPLTQSFVKEVYYQIVKNVLRRVTTDEKTVLMYENVLKDMVAVANGRIYYQIDNWYNIIKILPFNKKIIPMWQEMLGIENKSIRFDNNISITINVKYKVISNFFKLLKTVEKEMEELNIFFMYLF